MAAPVVRVGVGVLVLDPYHRGKVFAGLRRNSHGDGTLALPGGHLEMYETWEECAIRETREETGLVVRDLRFGHVTNDIMMDRGAGGGGGGGKHYVTIFMMGKCIDERARPRNMEPDKCHGWRSYSWEELRRYAAKGGASGDDSDEANGQDEEECREPILFGPLLQLVKDAPQNVLNFLAE